MIWLPELATWVYGGRLWVTSGARGVTMYFKEHKSNPFPEELVVD